MTGPTDTHDTPPDPRRDRFVPLSVAMLRLLVLIALGAAAALLAPGPWGTAAGWSMVGVLIAAPLLRVLWLVHRWVRRGDPRYAAVGVGVLAVVAVGTALAAL